MLCILCNAYMKRIHIWFMIDSTAIKRWRSLCEKILKLHMKCFSGVLRLRERERARVWEWSHRVVFVTAEQGHEREAKKNDHPLHVDSNQYFNSPPLARKKLSSLYFLSVWAEETAIEWVNGNCDDYIFSLKLSELNVCVCAAHICVKSDMRQNMEKWYAPNEET